MVILMDGSEFRQQMRSAEKLFNEMKMTQ